MQLASLRHARQLLQLKPPLLPPELLELAGRSSGSSGTCCRAPNRRSPGLLWSGDLTDRAMQSVESAHIAVICDGSRATLVWQNCN